MIHHFCNKEFTWSNIEKEILPNDGSPFKDMSRQILFNGLGDVPCQLRYFELQPGGYAPIEHHDYVHLVVIFRGSGQVLMGTEVHDVTVGDVLIIEPQKFHQFKANKGEVLGFLCLVNSVRGTASFPTDKELDELKQHKAVQQFLGNDSAPKSCCCDNNVC